ncbi:MAG: hypothetical protein M3Q99_08015 [Acidobacteriota bacterium]|nr:hypothetical protein [Acidobacteriota bacterium]
MEISGSNKQNFLDGSADVFRLQQVSLSFKKGLSKILALDFWTYRKVFIANIILRTRISL